MLTKKILSFKVNNRVKKNLITHTSIAYNEAKKIGLIFSIDGKDKHEIIKNFIKQLEADGKHVQVLAFLPKKKENHEFLFEFFTEKDLSFWGNIISDKVTSFINEPFDYLFYIDEDSDLLLQNILAMSKAKCRVAKFDESNERFCEMMVKVPGKGQLKQLASEMYRYTKILS